MILIFDSLEYLNQFKTHRYYYNVFFALIDFSTLKGINSDSEPIAIKQFKEEAATRFSSGNPSTVLFLLRKGFLNVFPKEEAIFLIFESLKCLEQFKTLPLYYDTFVELIESSLSYYQLLTEEQKNKLFEDFIANYLLYRENKSLNFNNRIFQKLDGDFQYLKGKIIKLLSKMSKRLALDYNFSGVVGVNQYLVKLEPNSWKALYRLGISFHNDLKDQKAYQTFRKCIKVIKLKNKNFCAKDNYKIEVIAAEFLDSRLIQDSINAIQCLVEIYPSNIKYKLYIAQLLFILNKYNVAKEFLLKAYKMERKNIKVLNLLAFCYWYQKKIKDFIKISKKTLKLLPQNKLLLYHLGLFLKKRIKNNEAHLRKYDDRVIDFDILQFSINFNNYISPSICWGSKTLSTDFKLFKALKILLSSYMLGSRNEKKEMKQSFKHI